MVSFSTSSQAQSIPLQPDCAITDVLLGGQGFTFSGQGFTFSGQGFTFSGQGFTFSGMGFTFSGQGFTFSGQGFDVDEQGFTFSGQDYSDPELIATEIVENEIDPTWLSNFANNTVDIQGGRGYGSANSAILIVDINDHLGQVQQVINQLNASMNINNVVVDTIDISDPAINYRVANIADAIDAKVQTLRAQGVNNIAINMSLAFIPCADPVTGFNFDYFIQEYESRTNPTDPGDLPGNQPVQPIFECVYQDGNRTYARFGYDNNNAETVTLSAGGNQNRFTPSPQYRDQPTIFESGRHYGVVDIRFSSDIITWELVGPDGMRRFAEATLDGALCETGATNPTQPIIPILECVIDNEDGTFTARFGYDNENDTTVYIPGGGNNNKFRPNPGNRGQVTHFLPGRQPSVFEVTYSNNPITWRLRGPDNVIREVESTTEANGCASDEDIFDLADYLTFINVPEDEVVPTLIGYIYDTTDTSPLRTLLQGYLNESADPTSPYNTVAIASAGNYRFWGALFNSVPETPLAPARWPEVVAVSASLNNNPNQIWAFSQHGNVMTRGVSYAVGDTELVAGTSFAAPGASVLMSQFFKYPDACTFPVVNGVAQTPLRSNAFDYANASMEGSAQTPFFCDVPYNQLPVAGEDNYSVDEDTILTVAAPGVLANDTDADGDALMVGLLSDVSNGTLALQVDGSFSYIPDANFNGSDSFTYNLSDGFDLVTGTVNITVNPVNDAPVALDDNAITDEDVAVTVDVLVNDSDIEGDVLSVSAVSAAANGSVVINEDHTVTYTPNADFNGVDSFTYSASDGVDTSDATVTITINPVNDAPVAVGANVITDEDVSIAITLNGTDVDGDVLSYTLLTSPVNGTVSGIAPDLTYTPFTNFNGTDSFTFLVNDGTVDSAVATVNITVNPANDAPVADSQIVTTNEDMAVAIILTGSDIDGDALTFTPGMPANGVLSGVAPYLDYTPNPNFNGSDSFTFTVSDGLLSASGTVTINVTPINDAPVAFDDAAITDEDVAVTVNVLANDSDVDGDLLSVSTVSAASNGSVFINADNTVTYTPNAGFSGVDSFTYTMSDGFVNASATVTITVNNTIPDLATCSDVASTRRNQSVGVNVLSNDPGVNGLVITSVSTPANGTASLNNDHVIFYTPDNGYSGVDTFTYTISDGVSSGTGTVVIYVAQDNAAPSACNDERVTTVDNPVTIPVLSNDRDPDDDPLTVVSTGMPANGTVVINPDNGLRYTPDAGFVGTDSFTYTISDGTHTVTATVVITVNP